MPAVGTKGTVCPEDFYEYKGFSGSFHPISLSKEVARSILIPVATKRGWKFDDQEKTGTPSRVSYGYNDPGTHEPDCVGGVGYLRKSVGHNALGRHPAWNPPAV